MTNDGDMWQLGAAGEAFFVERVHIPVRRDLVTSPLSSPIHSNEQGSNWDESAAQDDWES